jgi:hypothetical protein
LSESGGESWAGLDVGRQLLGQFDAPSYVRRGLEVEQAWTDLLAALNRSRRQWLDPLGRRMAWLKARSGDWRRLTGDDPGALVALGMLENLLPASLRFPPGRAWWIALPRLEYRRWNRDLEEFNRFWRDTLETVDLAPVNRRREAYNRWYLLEKECALGSARLALAGYRPLVPATASDLVARLPFLPVPAPRTSGAG